MSWILNLTLMILAVLSIWSWTVALAKFLKRRREEQQSRSFLEAYHAAAPWQKTSKVVESMTGDYAELTRAGLSVCQSLSGAEGEGMGVSELKDTIERELRKESFLINRRSEWGMAVLASIGSVSPFVGLFGTVWGIMNALETISATGQASIDVVAGPIGEALITTAIGIATAVPAVLAYNYFLRQRRLKSTLLEVFAADFLRTAMSHRQCWSEL